MKNRNTRKKIVTIASLCVILVLIVGTYTTFFHGPDGDGGRNIAIYLKGKPMDVDVFSSELNRYIYKDLENGKHADNILDVSPERIGKEGGVLRFEGKDWDRNITITFADNNQQLIRNVIEKSTEKSLQLHINMHWQGKLKNARGWSITVRAGEGE